MPDPVPYVTYDDVKAVCPYLDNLQPGEDQFETQRVSARTWFDNVVMAALGVREPVEIVADSQVKKANAFYAAAEILGIQITPMVDANAYGTMAARYYRHADTLAATVLVTVVSNGQPAGVVKLGVSRRGRTV